MRILIRGGSIAAGKGVAENYTGMISREIPGHEIIVKAKEGDTTFDGVWDFNKDIDVVKPDILVLHFAIDDIYLPVYRSEFKENLVQIVRLARVRFSPRVVLMTSHPFEDSYEMDSANIYYRTVREVAFDLECDYVPIHLIWVSHLFENNLIHKDYILSDSRLPNEKGHRIYADALLSRLGDMIK